MHPTFYVSSPTITSHLVWCSDGTIGRDIIEKVSYCSPPSIEYKDYSELKELGIDKVVEGGINDFGFRERMVVCEDGSVWDYIPEDRIYEKRN